MMKVEIVDDGMGFDMKMTGEPQEFARALDFLKVMIPKRCRSFDDARQTWRIEKRAAKQFTAWLPEMHGPNLHVTKRRVVREVKTLEQMVKGAA
jgi:hypothetical protein